MRRVFVLFIFLMAPFLLFSQYRVIGHYRQISIKEISPEPEAPIDIPSCTLKLDYGSMDETDYEAIEQTHETFLKWERNGIVSAKFPKLEDMDSSQVYCFKSGIFFSTKSRLWIVPYSFQRYDEDSYAYLKSPGLLFFSEDGSLLIKKIEYPDNREIDIKFQNSTFNDSLHYQNCTTDEHFFCIDKIISVYGDIGISFPPNSSINEISFTKDNKHFSYYDRNSEEYTILSMTSYEPVYKGLLADGESFQISSDGTWGVTVNRYSGNLTIQKIDPLTKMKVESFNPHISDIKGIPYTLLYEKNDNGENIRYYYDIKARFEEGSNFLIITTNNKWESVVEILDNEK